MTTVRPAPPRLLDFVQRHWARIRIGLHILLWLLTFGLASYSLSILTPNDLFVRKWFTLGISLLTLAFFYVSGYLILPRYLYTFQPLKLLISLTLLFLIVHICTYGLLYYVHTYNTVDNSFINRYWTLFKSGGLLGCFTNIRIAIQDIILTSNVSFIYLVPKVAKDLVTILSRSLQLQRDNLKLELDFLKTQVNPHFLFNTLNSVYARIFEADQQAASLVLHLSELMRYNLYETDQPRIGLDKELAYIQNYLDLERTRLAGQDVLIEYEQRGAPGAHQIAPLLLIAFVENAFKHGVKGATEPAYVQVKAQISELGQLIFRVENSVPVRRPLPTPAVRSGGVGLANVQRRLDALYPDRYTLTTQGDDQIYTVTLTIGLSQSH